jgi:hypothetical protein
MELPQIPLPTGTVEVGGQTVTFHALSRAAAVGLSRFQDEPGQAEPYLVAQAMDIGVDEAETWLGSVPFAEGSKLIEAIILLTGLGETNPGKA